MPCQLYHRSSLKVKREKAEFIIFFKQLEIGKLLIKSGAGKEKGISIVEIFKYLISLMLSERIVNKFLRPLTSEKRDDVFIIDDSTYKKTVFKKTELVAKVFDHVSMKYIKGFRMLILGWSDGCSFIPITHRLLSSSNDKNVFGITKTLDKRSLEYRRRKQAREKATDVMVDLSQRTFRTRRCQCNCNPPIWAHLPKQLYFDTKSVTFRSEMVTLF